MPEITFHNKNCLNLTSVENSISTLSLIYTEHNDTRSNPVLVGRRCISINNNCSNYYSYCYLFICVLSSTASGQLQSQRDNSIQFLFIYVLISHHKGQLKGEHE
jgi:hypothetical protein